MKSTQKNKATLVKEKSKAAREAITNNLLVLTNCLENNVQSFNLGCTRYTSRVRMNSLDLEFILLEKKKVGLIRPTSGALHEC